MGYKLMRARKYYDIIRTNKPFLKTSVSQKLKIMLNILRYYNTSLSKSLIIKNKPVTAQIEPTSECNLDCEMCVRDKIGVPIGSMSFEDFKKILDKLDSLFKINISGQGELFLNPEIFDMIRYANKKGIIVNIVSNGTLITAGIIDKICRVNIGEIAISLDSTKKLRYEKIRKNANFDKVLENIKNLCLELKKKGGKTIVSIATTILKDNVDEILDFVILCKKLGVKKIAFQSVQTKADYVRNYSKNGRKQIVDKLSERIDEEIKKAKKLAKKYKISIIFDEEKSPGCIWPWRGIYVTWNGGVTVCCKALDYRKPMLGNLIKQDFWEVWNSKNYQIFRKMLKQRKVPFDCCNGCNRV